MLPRPTKGGGRRGGGGGGGGGSRHDGQMAKRSRDFEDNIEAVCRNFDKIDVLLRTSVT